MIDRLEARLGSALHAAEDGERRTEVGTRPPATGPRHPEARVLIAGVADPGPASARPATFPPEAEPSGSKLAANKISDAESNAPIGPSAEEEAAFLATDRVTARSPPTPTAFAKRVEPATDKHLPALESLKSRVPPEVHALLDELFRAKFTAVRRVPESALNS